MKKCPRCNRLLSIESFHKNRARFDGVAAQCKECKNKMTRKAYFKNKEHYHQTRILRYKNNKEKETKQHKEWSIRNRDKLKIYAKRQDRKNPIRRSAYNKTIVALRNGTLKKQACEGCGCIKNIQAHHNDYFKPLEVNWFCPACHTKIHGRAV